jgi:hypothetical protein
MLAAAAGFWGNAPLAGAGQASPYFSPPLKTGGLEGCAPQKSHPVVRRRPRSRSAPSRHGRNRSDGVDRPGSATTWLRTSKREPVATSRRCADGGTGVSSRYVATKRADLDRLAEELSALNSEEREQVLRAASQWGPSGRCLSWEDF